MNNVDKQIDILSDLEQELYAMKMLGADEDIIKKQEAKIKRQKNKVYKAIQTAPVDPKD